MRTAEVLALAAVQLLCASALADCPYAVLEAEVEPRLITHEDGARALRWMGQAFMYDQISIWDLDVRVMPENRTFVATYSVTNDSRRARQKARMYFYFENPAVEAPADEEFISAGLLGSSDSPAELGAISSKCRLYEHTNFPSKSLGDVTSRHNLKPGLTDNVVVTGALKIRGSADALDDVIERLGSNPPKLKMLISVKEASDRH